MYYTIEALTDNKRVTIDTLTGVDYLTAFATWEEIVMDTHDGFQIDIGRRGWLSLNPGDNVFLTEHREDDGGGSSVIASETISAEGTKRRI